ncbi:hypothetical protein Syun_001796 [Stephania yunnanensis]|uniref:Uncharacterized protein n=1 Tax=Stephania yunnanensis TaxID=152371 RepID=A0AAP0LEK4_9MAGN
MANTSRAIIESVLYLETLFFHQPRMSKSPFCFSHPSSKYISISDLFVVFASSSKNL